MMTLTAVMIALSVLAARFDYFPADLWFTQQIQSGTGETFLAVMEKISWSTEEWRAVVIVGMIVILLWRTIGWKAAAVMALIQAMAGFNWLLKVGIIRPRPDDGLVFVSTLRETWSFPSGHSFFAVITFGLVAWFVWQTARSQPLRIGLTSFFIVLIILVGFSRIAVGEHWLSDVIGGYLFGGICLYLATRFYVRFGIRERKTAS